MPCNSDHLEPMRREIDASRVLCVLDELNAGRPIDDHRVPQWWYGYHPSAYMRILSKEDVDRWTAEACGKLSKLKPAAIRKMSLELQLWWREHQKADAERKARERREERDKELRAQALAKLTPAERRALGVDDE